MIHARWKTEDDRGGARQSLRREAVAMNIKQSRGFILALLLTVASSARAADEAAVVKEAASLLEEISSNPESGIPSQHLREAIGIVIIPRIVETRLGIGRKRGHGVFLARDEHGEWGHPEPVEISGLSVGAQAGRAVRDMVMIYRTREAADRYGVTALSMALTFQVSGSLKRKDRLYPPWLETDSSKDLLVYTRYRGFLVGAGIRGERRWGPSFAPVDLKTAPTTDSKVAEGKAEVRVTPDAAAPEARAKHVGDSPEVTRLKTVLTAMTRLPPAQVAATGKKDVSVSPAGGTRPPAETAATPR
jgi:lipid-binding SYLF domain-containing protein